MCNLYSITINQVAISALFRVVNRYVGNLAPMPGVFPDYKAPIVRNGADGRELATARWGMPSSSKALMDATKKRAEKLQAKGKPVDFKELLQMEPDGGTTNIRNVKSKHWTRWLGVENRCVVPFNSFSEFNKAEGGDIWFALNETRPSPASPESGPTGHPCGKSRKARPPTTSTHSSRRSRTPRLGQSIRGRCRLS
jgi:putative SOS response-associated peptidase YedK